MTNIVLMTRIKYSFERAGLHGVMDIISAYEAGGSGFDPQWGLF